MTEEVYELLEIKEEPLEEPDEQILQDTIESADVLSYIKQEVGDHPGADMSDYPPNSMHEAVNATFQQVKEEPMETCTPVESPLQPQIEILNSLKPNVIKGSFKTEGFVFTFQSSSSDMKTQSYVGEWVEIKQEKRFENMCTVKDNFDSIPEQPLETHRKKRIIDSMVAQVIESTANIQQQAVEKQVQRRKPYKFKKNVAEIANCVETQTDNSAEVKSENHFQNLKRVNEDDVQQLVKKRREKKQPHKSKITALGLMGDIKTKQDTLVGEAIAKTGNFLVQPIKRPRRVKKTNVAMKLDNMTTKILFENLKETNKDGINDLKQHVQELNNNRHLCSHCNHNFATNQGLRGHQIRLHYCEYCKTYLESEAVTKTHRAIHRNKKIPLSFQQGKKICDMCYTYFSSNELRKNHLTSFSCIASECRYCGKEIKSRPEYETHMMEEHSSATHCAFCEMLPVETKMARRHYLLHTHITLLLYQCAQCKQRFRRNKDYVSHKCPMVQDTTCEICSLIFVNLIDLDEHMRVCEQMVDSKYSLRRINNKRRLQENLNN